MRVISVAAPRNESSPQSLISFFGSQTKLTAISPTQIDATAGRRTRPSGFGRIVSIHHASITAEHGHSGNRYARRLYAAIEKNTTETIQKIASSRTQVRARRY